MNPILLDIDLTYEQEDFIEEENSCCLCGSDLAFDYELDHIQQTVIEKAHCSVCSVPLKDKEHPVH